MNLNNDLDEAFELHATALTLMLEFNSLGESGPGLLQKRSRDLNRLAMFAFPPPSQSPDNSEAVATEEFEEFSQLKITISSLASNLPMHYMQQVRLQHSCNAIA